MTTQINRYTLAAEIADYCDSSRLMTHPFSSSQHMQHENGDIMNQELFNNLGDMKTVQELHHCKKHLTQRYDIYLRYIGGEDC